MPRWISVPTEDELADEWEQLARFDWLVIVADRPSRMRLHALGTLDDRANTGRQWIGAGTTACGRHGTLALPGIFSRGGFGGGLPRCTRCCRATGMPRGDGSPKNSDDCRRLLGLPADGTGVAR